MVLRWYEKMDFEKIVKDNKDLLNAREYEVAIHHAKSDQYKLLSDEHERAAYMWFAAGRSLKDISSITGFPEGTVVITAIYHQWHERKIQLLESLKETGNKKAIENIVQDNLNSMFFLTIMVAQRDIQDVFMGRKDANQCSFMPNNMNELQKFIQMVMQANNLNNLLASQGKTNTNININNANNTLNQGLRDNEEQITASHSKIDLLKSLNDEKQSKLQIKEKVSEPDIDSEESEE